MKLYTLAALNSMPTIHQWHTDDLKIKTRSGGTKDTRATRGWISRLTVEDGQPYNNQVTIEQYLPGNGKPNFGYQWVTTEQYEAK